MFIKAQIEYLLYLQNLRAELGDAFTVFFLQITKFGEYLIPFSVIASIYWCVNKRVGAFLILNCGFAMMFNLLLKNIACLYRPWILDARIKPVEAALKYAGGYSFPSGHTAIAVSCWGAIGLFWRRIKGMLPLMILLCVLIGFSRNYVGVHMVQDVVVAALVTVIFLVIGWQVFGWAEKYRNGDLLLCLGMTLFSLMLTVYIYYKTYPQDYVNGALVVDPAKCKMEVFSKLGFVLGGFCGWYLERKLINFSENCKNFAFMFKRTMWGLIPLFLMLGMLSSFCRWLFETQSACFLGLFAISFYITFIYPCIFSRIEQIK